jgi:hypothetical protein
MNTVKNSRLPTGEFRLTVTVNGVELHADFNDPRTVGIAKAEILKGLQEGRYFCAGPQGHFYCDDLELARDLVDAYDKDEDWTITDLTQPAVDGCLMSLVRQKPDPVDELAQEIRRVDGNHDLGAGRLAEALIPFIEAKFGKRA